ncbi:MAG: hypothetical protein RLZZ303_1994 [Candidatus Hydrogenedentota bacterium]|jgi:hypothetical protein
MKFPSHSLFVVCVVIAPLISGPASAAIDHVYIVAGQDPSTSMVVQFHTANAAESLVRYDTEPEAEGNPLDFSAKGTSHQIPGLEDGRRIHAVELKELQPATTYYFSASNGKSGSFRTLPTDDAPIRAIFGGDIGVLPLASMVLKAAAKENPDIAVLGGDIAYANGDLKNILAWDMWLSRWEGTMKRADGAMIPMIVAIGNHEVNKLESTDPLVRAPFFFHLFAQGGKTYFTRSLGPNVGLIALDTGHITPHEEQVDFLRQSLEAVEEKPYIFTTYHVPFYPSHRSYDDSRSIAGREHWQPIFEEYNVSIGFEHHDHTFKRTKPIRGGEVSEDGIVYLGDGSMGVAVRDIKNGDAWYIEKAEEKAHVWVVDIHPEKVQCRAIDHFGQQFDEISFAPRLVTAN